jgi:hypothetical protein
MMFRRLRKVIDPRVVSIFIGTQYVSLPKDSTVLGRFGVLDLILLVLSADCSYFPIKGSVNG